MVVPVGAHQVSQDLGVAAVGLGARDRMPVAVAADRQRVDPIHLVAGGQQRPNQQPPVGLDPDHDLLGILGIAGKQSVQLGDADQPIGDAALGQHRALRVEQADVVVPLGPVHSDEQHSHLPGSKLSSVRAGEGPRRPNGSAHLARHPTSRSGLLADQPGHALPQELQWPGKYLQCSPAGSSPRVSPNQDPQAH